MTNYYQVLQRILYLEWFQTKLQFDAVDVLRMEHHLGCGLPYWKDDEFDQRIKQGITSINLSDSVNQRASKYFKEQIDRIRTKKDFAESVASISLSVRNLIAQYQRTRPEKQLEYLHQSVEFKFQQIVATLYKLVPQFFIKKNIQAIEAIQSATARLIRMDHVKLKLLRPNNYSVSINIVDPLLVNLESGNLIFGSMQNDKIINFNRCV